VKPTDSKKAGTSEEAINTTVTASRQNQPTGNEATENGNIDLTATKTGQR